MMVQYPGFSVQESEEKIKAPLIFEIMGNSLDDGPGIRTVVFFKGCPLSCIWCHNPESKSRAAEISFDPKACVACDTCLETCTEKALSRANPRFIDRSRCTLCFSCTESCPSGALSRVGMQMPVEEVMSKILPDKPFFDNSGGGVTLSGGEPTMFMEYASELLKELKKAGIHTLLETCGLFNFKAFEKKIIAHLDAVYFDIKIFDREEHRRYCGVPNDIILKNFELLRDAPPVLFPRTPLIPGITDTETNLRAIGTFFKRQKVRRAAILAYNPLWFEKCRMLGVDAPFGSDERKKTWTSRESLRRAKAIFQDYGIDT
jgi:pyruvate formate lyase activating enzyme